jgi:hypothetical protein
MQPITLNDCQATSRRRGFEVVSRLARQRMATGRRVSEANPDEWVRHADSTTYEPRHRREDSPLFRQQLSVG